MTANTDPSLAHAGFDAEHSIAVDAVVPGREDRQRVLAMARTMLAPPGSSAELQVSRALELQARIVVQLAQARPGVPLPTVVLAAVGLTRRAITGEMEGPKQRMQ